MASSRNFLIKFGAESKSVTQAIRQITAGTREATNLAKSAGDAFKFTGDASSVNRAMSEVRKQISQTENVAEQLKNELNTGLKTGSITQGSAKYNQLTSAINKTETQANKLKTSLGEASKVNPPKAGLWDRLKNSMRGISKLKMPNAKSLSGLTSGLKKASSAASSLVGNLGANAISSAVGAITGSLGSIAQGALSNADAMNKFQQTMTFGGATKKETEEASKAMKQYADETVYDTNDIMSTTAQLKANGIKNYTGLTKAAGNLNAIAGGNKDTFKTVAQVMTQTAGAGKLTTENWNQIRDAIPGASGIIQKALKKNGAFTGNFADAMEKGQISSDEFNKAITDLGNNPGAVKAAKSTSTFEGAMGNLQATAENAGLKIINAIGMKNITGAIDAFSGAIDAASKYIQPFFGQISKGFKQIGSGTSVLTPISNVFKDIGSKLAEFGKGALPGVVNWFKQMGSVLTGGFISALGMMDGLLPGALKLLGQVGDIVGGVLLAAFKAVTDLMPTFSGVIFAAQGAFANIMKFIQPVVNIFTNILIPIWTQMAQMLAPLLITAINGIGEVFATLAPYIQAAGAKIQEIWTLIQPFYQQLVNALQPALTAIISVFKTLASILGTALNVALNVIIGLLKSPIFQGFLKVIINIVKWVGSLYGAFANMLKNALPGIQNFLVAIGDFLKNLILGIIALPGKIWDGIKSIGGFFGKLISSWITAAHDGVKKQIAFFKRLPGKIWDAMKGIGEIGANLVKGLWNGIKDMGSWIGEKLKGFGKGVTNKLKKFFGIHSPSTLMRDEIGKYLAMGVGTGIDKYADTALAPMNKLKGQLTGGLSDIDLGAPTASLDAKGYTGYQPQQSTGAAPINFTINNATQNTANEVRKVLRQEGLTK